jgi:hypothetical protein
MTTSSTTITNQILPRLLAARVLMAPRPVPIMLPMVNQYSIQGLPTQNLRLNRWADPGPGTTATEGTTFSTVTDFTMVSAVDINPTEAAVMLGKITDEAVEKQGNGYDNALELFQSNNINAQLAVMEPEAISVMMALDERLERDLAGLFTSATNTVGVLTNDMSLSVLEQAIFTADTLEQPNNLLQNRVAVLGPRGVSDLRKELMVTSGGVQGVMWANGQAPQTQSAQAGQVGRIWVPIFQLSQTVVPTSGTVPGTGGHVGALILAGRGNPEQEGGSGELGSIAFVEGRRPTFASSLVLRDRSLDFLGIHKYGFALRAQDLIVGILYDDA